MVQAFIWSMWDLNQLDDCSKSIILAPPEKPPLSQARRISMHKISACDYFMANLYLSMEGMDDDPIHVQSKHPDPAPCEDLSASDQVIINAAKQSKPAPNPVDIWHVLSKKSQTSASHVPKSSEEIIVNGKTYWQVHFHTYSVSASNNSSTQCLVDHGANGRIGGSDVHVIHKTKIRIDIHGITTIKWWTSPLQLWVVTSILSVVWLLPSFTWCSMHTLVLALLSILQPSLYQWCHDKSIKVGGLYIKCLLHR